MLGVWGGFKRRSVTIVMSIVMMGASLTVSGFLPSNGFLFFVVCCLFMGFAVPFYSAVEMALFQQKIESTYLGRVFSLVGSLVSISMPLGLLLSASFADKVGVNQWFAISGILILGIALVSYLLPAIRHLD